MDYTQTVLAAELLRGRQTDFPRSSFEEELLCLQEQAAEAKVVQDSKQPQKAAKRTKDNLAWFQWLVLGSGSN